MFQSVMSKLSMQAAKMKQILEKKNVTVLVFMLRKLLHCTIEGRIQMCQVFDSNFVIFETAHCCPNDEILFFFMTDSIDHRESNVPNNWTIDDGDACPLVEIPRNTLDSSVACVTGLPSIRVSEPNNLSSGSDDNSSGLPHRRKQKLRYLADILQAEKSSQSGTPRIKRASSSGMHIVSSKCGAVLAPQHAVVIPEDVQRRKTPHVEDRITEISDSKSEGNDLKKLDLQLGTKTQWIKTRKRKTLDSSKKKRHIHIVDETIPAQEVPEISTVDSVYSHKHAAIGDTSFCKLADAPSMLGQTSKNFKSFQSGQHIDRNSCLSRNKRPEVEADQITFIPPINMNTGEGNINGKVGLSFSLNNVMNVERTSNQQTSFIQQRGIPGKHPWRKVLPLDLNETFTPTMGEELTALSGNESFRIHDTLVLQDFFTVISCSSFMFFYLLHAILVVHKIV